MEHGQTSSGFLDSIITSMVDFSKDVVAIARGTARGGVILAEQGIEAIKGTVELIDPRRVAEDVRILTSVQVPEIRVNPNTGRAETVLVTKGLLARTIDGVKDFVSGAINKAASIALDIAKDVGGAAKGLFPTTTTIIIILGLLAVIAVSGAVVSVT